AFIFFSRQRCPVASPPEEISQHVLLVASCLRRELAHLRVEPFDVLSELAEDEVAAARVPTLPVGIGAQRQAKRSEGRATCAFTRRRGFLGFPRRGKDPLLLQLL